MQLFKRILPIMLLSLFMSGFSFAHTTASKQAYVQWIDENSDRTVSKQAASDIVDAVFKNASKRQIDPLLVLSIIKAESGFRSRIQNSYGASGLMQVVPRFHRTKIAGRNILQINTNVEVGVTILHDCLVSSNDNFYKAMRCYSGGAGKKYLQNIRKTHNALKSADVAMRFRRELPVVQHNAWGDARTYQPSIVVASGTSDTRKVQ